MCTEMSSPYNRSWTWPMSQCVDYRKIPNPYWQTLHERLLVSPLHRGTFLPTLNVRRLRVKAERWAVNNRHIGDIWENCFALPSSRLEKRKLTFVLDGSESSNSQWKIKHFYTFPNDHENQLQVNPGRPVRKSDIGAYTFNILPAAADKHT